MEKITNMYTGEQLEVELPNATKYGFLLERNQKYMNNIALSFNNKKITYEEMHTRIDEYARALSKKGIKQGDVIAVCVANTPEAVYLLYALDKLGATVVGLSPMNNEYKMQRDLEIVKPKMVITVDMMYSKFKNVEDTLNFSSILFSPVESLNSPFIKALYNLKQRKEGNYKKGREYNLRKIVKDGKDFNAVYGYYVKNAVTDIMFTGGSSGVHKGVDLTGNGLNSVVQALDYVLILEPGMIHLGNIPFGHMAFGRLVMHYALCKNLEFALTLEMLPNKFYEEIVRTKADGAMGGPVHWNALANNPSLKEGTLTNLKQALSGGEMFKEEDRLRADEKLAYAGSSAKIGDGLGLTEMWAPTHVNMGGVNTPNTIGYAIPFVKSKVVDFETFEEVEQGKDGLLLVNGPGMMLGYHANIEETNKVFSYDKEGTRWYNTGDCVVLTDKNEYKFVGRKKRNFVCGCDNIYPEQIEVLLQKLPEIKEVIVTAIKDAKYQYLPKYRILLADETCDHKTLEVKINTLISNTLGESALPGYIEYVNTPFLRTDNGKLNATYYQQQDDLKEKVEDLGLKLKK